MKTYLRIIAFARPYKKEIGLYAVFTFLCILFAGFTFVMLQPLLELLFNPHKATEVGAAPEFSFSVKYITGYVQYLASSLGVAHGKGMALLCVSVFIVGLNLATNIFKFFSNYFLGTIRTRVVQDIRDALFNKLAKMHVGYVESGRKGDIMTRIMSDVSEVEHSVVVTFESIIRDPLNIIYVLALMLSFSWKLTLVIFIVLPISAIIISRITKALKRDATETQDIYGRIMSVVDESISGVRIIKAFNAEGYIQKSFGKLNERYSALTRRQWHKRALVPIFSESAMVFTFGIVLWYGGRLVYSGDIENASGFITYLGLFFLLSNPAKALSSAFGNINKGIASGERMFQLMDTEVEILEKENPIRLHEFKDSLRVENLTFAYVDEPVIKNLNLEIKKGKIYAIVGPSGSGKSTLTELLLRFYDPQSGRILIDGIDLTHLKIEDLRNLTAVVTQEAILFNDTIFNNIAFGITTATEAAVIEAAKAANAHDFIMEIPDGYNAIIGDRGGLLSGGQRQRLSIARAILKNPPILILDEATSALDTNSEKIVQDALYKLMANRTSIVIAHRLSTIQEADEIIVMEHGMIAEKGSHQELIAKGGIYNHLYKLQQLEG